MSRNLSLPITTVALLVMFSSCLLQEASAWELIDHCMCKDLETTYGIPFYRTNQFTPTDELAFCWFAFDITDLSGDITVTFMWHDPSDELYAKGVTRVSGGSSWFVAGILHIRNSPPAGKPGEWRVDVYVDGGSFRDKKLFTEYFTIAESATIERLYPVTVSISGVPSTFSANLWVDDKWVGTIAGGASKAFNFTYGTSHRFAVDAYIDATTDTRYYCSANTWTCSSEGPHTFGYHAQYYLTVNSAYHPPKGSGWYDSSSTATFDVTPSTLDHGNGTRHLFESWSGDSTETSPSASIIMDGPKIVEANWEKQYHLTVSSPYGSPTGIGWYSEKATAQFEVTSPIEHGNATRHVFIGWSGDSTAATPIASIIMDGPKTLTANWKTQYQLAVTSGFGSITGGGWYDADSTATFDVTPSTLDHGNGTRHLFESWSGDLTETSPSASVVLDSPKTVTANWKTQYHLTVSSPYGSPTGIGWYDAGSLATFSAPPSYPMEGLMGMLGGKYVFQSWSGDLTGATPTATVKMDGSKTLTATWATDLTMPYATIGSIGVAIGVATGIVIKTRKKEPIKTKKKGVKTRKKQSRKSSR